VPGHHVVEGELYPGLPAVLAALLVAGEDFLAGEPDARPWAPYWLMQADDGGQGEVTAHAMDGVVVEGLEDLGFAVIDEHEGAPDRADVQRLVILVQDKGASLNRQPDTCS
jgi:hypothetical protein